MGVDRNDLNYYRTIRGTNSIEGGIHMPLRRTFGSLNASPELADALLCNWRDRRNTTVCNIFIHKSITTKLLFPSGGTFQ